jgi:uncharacterized protein
MDLQTRLTEDMKSAMKAGQKERLSVIRMLLSDVKNADLMPGKPPAEQVVSAYAKKLRKSAEEYEKHGKSTAVQQLKSELKIVEEYLPKRASPEETERLVDEFLARHAFTEKQVGQATGGFMKEHGENVEAGVVNQLMRKKLASKSQ